jgi:hypothetical protein
VNSYEGDDGRLFDMWMPKAKPLSRRVPVPRSLDDIMGDLALRGESYVSMPTRPPTEFDDDLIEMRQAESA